MSAGGIWRTCDFHILFTSPRYELFLSLWSSFSSTLHGSWVGCLCCVCAIAPVPLSAWQLRPCNMCICSSIRVSGRPIPVRRQLSNKNSRSFLLWVRSCRVHHHTKKSEWGVWPRFGARSQVAVMPQNGT